MFTWLLFYGFFQRPTAQAREQIFTQNTSNDVVPCKDVSFRVRKKFTPYFRKLPLLGPLLTGQKHYRPKNRFTMGDAPYTAYAQHIANFAIKMARLQSTLLSSITQQWIKLEA